MGSADNILGTIVEQGCYVGIPSEMGGPDWRGMRAS